MEGIDFGGHKKESFPETSIFYTFEDEDERVHVIEKDYNGLQDQTVISFEMKDELVIQYVEEIWKTIIENPQQVSFIQSDPVYEGYIRGRILTNWALVESSLGKIYEYPGYDVFDITDIHDDLIVLQRVAEFIENEKDKYRIINLEGQVILDKIDTYSRELEGNLILAKMTWLKDNEWNASTNFIYKDKEQFVVKETRWDIRVPFSPDGLTIAQEYWPSSTYSQYLINDHGEVVYEFAEDEYVLAYYNGYLLVGESVETQSGSRSYEWRYKIKEMNGLDVTGLDYTMDEITDDNIAMFSQYGLLLIRSYKDQIYYTQVDNYLGDTVEVVKSNQYIETSTIINSD